MKKHVKLILISLLILLVIKTYSSLEMSFPFYPYIDTIFTKDFSWNNYNNITKGMRQEEVRALIGEPLLKRNYGSDPKDECWRYTTDGKLQPYADFSWYSVQVCFKDGVVDTKPVNEFND
jgi:outer membrane protein assembly factor BamE (lipoprotein component of BamABCDE complex)